MVSGLVTSPCDQLRIFSGDARLMRMASKSAIGFAMSKGLERYKVILRFLQVSRARPRLPGANGQLPVASSVVRQLGSTAAVLFFRISCRRPGAKSAATAN